MNRWIGLLGPVLAFAGEGSYALGVGVKASERLQLQQSILGRDFENHLLEAGLKKDMVVLEIGCGNGIMACWVASQVGEEGRVIAVDKSPEQLAIAKEAALAQGIKNIEFVCSDAETLDLPKESIDFVYCRFLLMHLVNPLQVIEKMLGFLKEGGAFAAQEPINSATYFYSENVPFIEKFREHLRRISMHYGVDYDLGKKLYTLFYEAGFEPIHLHFSQRAVPISRMKHLLCQFFEDIGPAALKTGAISKEDLKEQMEAIENYPELSGSYYVVPQQVHVSAYKRF